MAKAKIQAGAIIPNHDFALDTDQDGLPDGYTKSAPWTSDSCSSAIVDPLNNGFNNGNMRSLLCTLPVNLGLDNSRYILSGRSRLGSIPVVLKDLELKIGLKFLYRMTCETGPTVTFSVRLLVYDDDESAGYAEVVQDITAEETDWTLASATGTISQATWGADDPDHVKFQIIAAQNGSLTDAAKLWIDYPTCGFTLLSDGDTVAEYETPIEWNYEGLASPVRGLGKTMRLPTGLLRRIDPTGGDSKQKFRCRFRNMSQTMRDNLYTFWRFNKGLSDVGVSDNKAGRQFPLVVEPQLDNVGRAFYCNWLDEDFPLSNPDGGWISSTDPRYQGEATLEEI